VIPKGDVPEWDVGRVDDPARTLVDGRRNAHCDRLRTCAQKGLDQSVQLSEKCLLARDVGRPDLALEHRSGRIHDPGEELGTAEIDGDNTLAGHFVRLP
jgi:hypothetical protein